MLEMAFYYSNKMFLYILHTQLLDVFSQSYFFCTKRASKIIVPPKEMLLSFSIGTFLSNYDVTNRKHKMDLKYSIVQKRTI